MFTHFANHSSTSFTLENRPPSRASSLGFRSRPFAHFRNSLIIMPSHRSQQHGPPKNPSAGGSPGRPRTSRWNRRSRQVAATAPPTASVAMPLQPVSMSTLYRDVELGVCVMDDGWALLVNPKNELNCVSVNTPPKPPALVVPTLSQEVDMARDFDPRGAVHNNRQRRPTPHGMTPSATLPGHNLHQLVAPTSSETENPDLVIPPRRQSLSGDRPAPPSAYLRPVPGRPVSVVSTPVTQAPVSCLRRKSLPPDFDGSRPSIKFAETDTPHAPEHTPNPRMPRVGQNDQQSAAELATRAATVASLNETVRLRRSYASLQSRHAQLYDAALDARTEIARLGAKLQHCHEVMEHLIDWGLAMQTENEVLREQIPDLAATMSSVNVKTAEELRALFHINFSE